MQFLKRKIIFKNFRKRDEILRQNSHCISKDTWKLIKKSEKFEKIQLFWKKGIKIESFKCGYSWKVNKPAFLQTQILSSIWVRW